MSETITAAYGSWPSPLSIDDVLTSGVGLRTLIGDGESVCWLETLPDEDGRTTLVRHHRGTTKELTPTPINVRSRVMEYGGGAYDVRDGWAVYVDDSTRAVHVLDPRTSDPQRRRRPITPECSDLRFGGVRIHPTRGLVTAIRENHGLDGEPVTEIVALRLDADQPERGVVLVSGADFYACAELSDDGRLAWIEWNHPHMPWDQTSLRVGGLGGDLRVTGVIDVVAEPDVSATYPRFTADGRLVFFGDQSGFWTPQVFDDTQVRSLTSADADHVGPLWILDHDTLTVMGTEVVVARFVDGRRQLVALPLDGSGAERLIGAPVAGVGSLAVADGALWALLEPDDRDAEVVRIDLTGQRTPPRTTVVRVASAVAPDPASVSRPEAITVAGRFGDVHAWFYPPASATHTGPDGELPPLVVRSHGGPTSMATSSYYPSIQFFTSRGVAVLDVNYSGSTGFGRAYRNRLRGAWGIADVADCVAFVRSLVAEGRVDADRVAITGGSAGGYTTLQALVTSDVFSAGISRYGIGDLEVLATDTHKFESRYLDSLIGPYPADQAVYVERSPIHHVDRLSTPMLILQGLDDHVVPPNQAQSMADAVRAKGLPVALVLFEGEGHGFRTLAARRRALQAELGFLGRLFGFSPADPLPALTIENLP